MKSKRERTKTVVEYQSKFKPKDIWEFLVHPKYAPEFYKEACYKNKVDDEFKLQPGNQWVEIHIGEHCKGDVVICEIVEVEANRKFESKRVQTGIENTTIYLLEENHDGTLIKEIQKYRISFKKFKPINILNWVLYITGLFTKFTIDLDEDKHWFQQMEQKVLASTHQSKST